MPCGGDTPGPRLACQHCARLAGAESRQPAYRAQAHAKRPGRAGPRQDSESGRRASSLAQGAWAPRAAAPIEPARAAAAPCARRTSPGGQLLGRCRQWRRRSPCRSLPVFLEICLKRTRARIFFGRHSNPASPSGRETPQKLKLKLGASQDIHFQGTNPHETTAYLRRARSSRIGWGHRAAAEPLTVRKDMQRRGDLEARFSDRPRGQVVHLQQCGTASQLNFTRRIFGRTSRPMLHRRFSVRTALESKSAPRGEWLPRTGARRDLLAAGD